MTRHLINDLYEVPGTELYMFKTTRTAPLSRATDPDTSKEAASKCESFRAKHEALIHEALFFFGDQGGTAKEIAAKIQMTDVQVNRRLSFMGGYENGVKVRIGVIERTSEVRHGGHVWRIAT